MQYVRQFSGKGTPVYSVPEGEGFALVQRLNKEEHLGSTDWVYGTLSQPPAPVRRTYGFERAREHAAMACDAIVVSGRIEIEATSLAEARAVLGDIVGGFGSRELWVNTGVS